MPVQKFRSLKEMELAPTLLPPGDAFRRFARHCARYRRLAQRRHPRGVYRFKSLEEAQAARERVSLARVTE